MCCCADHYVVVPTTVLLYRPLCCCADHCCCCAGHCCCCAGHCVVMPTTVLLRQLPCCYADYRAVTPITVLLCRSLCCCVIHITNTSVESSLNPLDVSTDDKSVFESRMAKWNAETHCVQPLILPLPNCSGV